ncbi:DNA (cytosine-5)-methyltransferase DRM2 [Thalictrum thalictroides]|uniref:DNA (cytosine-5-)-methyltransferase n=1 Tax=Thalictrum thalictroides TaxID=46969 RepID=A0A7J6XAQ0_THATH|nr:DNA (cytosine-5)-methyltransferase DRM2 [Thalictrum thalictroides]
MGDHNSDSDLNDYQGDQNGTPIILLPWYPNPTDCDQGFGSGYDYKGDHNRDSDLNDYWGDQNETPIILLPWYPNPTDCDQGFGSGYDYKASTSTPVSPQTKLISRFLSMGFPEELVTKAINETGKSKTEDVLDTILTYSALNNFSAECEPVPFDQHSSDCGNDFFDDLSDSDCCLGNEDDAEHLPDKEKKFLQLIDMGYLVEEASSAIDASGSDTTILELMDYITASQIANTANAPQQERPQPISDFGDEIDLDFQDCPTLVKRMKLSEGEERWKRKTESWRKHEKARLRQKNMYAHKDDTTIHVPKDKIGFGVPNNPRPMLRRKIPEEAAGPPFFYYENVSTARKRGYIHNLPIENRYPLLPLPPPTIQEVLPLTKKWWPSWDERTKLNCLNTCYASAQLTKRVKDALDRWDGVPPSETQRYVLYECRKWNLVWTGKNKVAPLEPDEIEMIMGYPKNHTRGGGISRTERYKALGNSFQVDTVAFHFSVLRSIYPHGMNVLSLFSGIGGAEVALDRLGIKLKSVVSIEISSVNRSIIRSWWEQTNQTGNLIEFDDVQELTQDKLEHLMQSVGGFDLVVGGSPCNNLTGSNRRSRDGLKGKHSILFYDYFRILNTVKFIMENNRSFGS